MKPFSPTRTPTQFEYVGLPFASQQTPGKLPLVPLFRPEPNLVLDEFNLWNNMQNNPRAGEKTRVVADFFASHLGEYITFQHEADFGMQQPEAATRTLIKSMGLVAVTKLFRTLADTPNRMGIMPDYAPDDPETPGIHVLTESLPGYGLSVEPGQEVFFEGKELYVATSWPAAFTPYVAQNMPHIDQTQYTTVTPRLKVSTWTGNHGIFG